MEGCRDGGAPRQMDKYMNHWLTNNLNLSLMSGQQCKDRFESKGFSFYIVADSGSSPGRDQEIPWPRRLSERVRSKRKQKAAVTTAFKTC